MRILIVNAHARAQENQKAFQDLLVCIKEVLKTHNGLLEIQDEYIIRTRENLEDFLYDDHTAFSQAGPGKKFDTLDFVIVSGDLHSLPWHPSNVKVLTLLRMCLKVKKCLFAIGSAMQALVYLSASNLDHHINVINGNGKGGKLGDLGQLQVPPDQIGNQDLFLDNVTGDLYHFQYESDEWAPLCNIGLHHSKTAQEFNTIGKFVIKTPIYRPKKSINNPVTTTLMDENVEMHCYVKKVFIKHWLFQTCDVNFVVPCKGRWEIHPFNFTNKDKTFEILAESEHGPLIIEYPRIIGVKFLVTKRYKETYHLLANFIVKYADEIICKGRNQDMSILAYRPNVAQSYRFQTNKTTPDLDGPASQKIGPKALQGFKHRRLTEMSPSPEPNTSEVFKHSGLASKMKGKVIMQHNFISSMKVRYDSQLNTPMLKESSKFLTKETLMGKYSLMPKRNQTEDDLSFLDVNRDSFSRADDRSLLKTANNISYRQNKRPNVKGMSMLESPKGILKHSIVEDDVILTKEDVRRWLYPDLNENKIGFEKTSWVPGNLSQNKSENLGRSKPIRVNTCSPDYRKRGPVQTLNYASIGVPQQSIRAADPYKSQHDIRKEHQKKEDEKILGPRKFVLSKGTTQRPSVAVSPSSRFASMMTPKY